MKKLFLYMLFLLLISFLTGCSNKYEYSRELIDAISEDNWEEFVALLEQGGDIDSKPYFLDTDGRSNMPPLHYACSKGKIKYVEALVEAGADVNNRNNWARISPIIITLQWCHPGTGSEVPSVRTKIVKYLLENGAGLDIKSSGESPMDYAFSYWSVDNKVLAQEEYELALYLIELGADIKSNYIYGGHLIFHSVMRNNLMMVKHLIEDENLNIDLVDNNHKNSILMWAVESNRLEIVEYLLEQGADIHIVNADGKTAFDLAYEQENLENEELEKNMKIRELLSEK